MANLAAAAAKILWGKNILAVLTPHNKLNKVAQVLASRTSADLVSPHYTFAPAAIAANPSSQGRFFLQAN